MVSTASLGSYARNTIAQGETAVLRAKYHPIMVIVPFCVGLPFLLFSLVGFLGTITQNDSPPGMAGFAFVLTCLFGWLFYAWPLLRYFHDEVVITDRRVIVKIGIIARQSRELFYNRIESVDLNQGIVARLLNYGTLVIRGSGGTAQMCKFIREPLQFRARIQQMQERSGPSYFAPHR